MKRYFFYIIGAILSLYACKSMDSEYKEFIVPNGYVYPQRADSLKANPGYNKLRLKWMKPKSPLIQYAMVYWNNYTDSAKVEWQPNQDTIYFELKDLHETAYTVYIKNFDKDGNVSLPAEVTGTPYGDNYLISATDRSYTAALRNADGTGTINWGPKTADLVYTEVRYEMADGTKKTVRIKPSENTITLPSVKANVLFEYRSVFLPNKGIDSIARDWKPSDAPLVYKFPRNTWTASTRGGNHDWGDGGGGQPFLLFDGNMSTGWHSKVGAGLPQVVSVDMKESLDLTHIIIYPPAQSNWRYMNKMEVYLSDTAFPADAPTADWGKPVSSVTYDGSAGFKINFGGVKKARYMAVVFLDSKSNTYISFMELEAYGY